MLDSGVWYVPMYFLCIYNSRMCSSSFFHFVVVSHIFFVVSIGFTPKRCIILNSCNIRYFYRVTCCCQKPSATNVKVIYIHQTVSMFLYSHIREGQGVETPFQDKESKLHFRTRSRNSTIVHISQGFVNICVCVKLCMSKAFKVIVAVESKD